jgi:hypothetical protein
MVERVSRNGIFFTALIVYVKRVLPYFTYGSKKSYPTNFTAYIGRPRRRWEDDLEPVQAVIPYFEFDDNERSSAAMVLHLSGVIDREFTFIYLHQTPDDLP